MPVAHMPPWERGGQDLLKRPPWSPVSGISTVRSKPFRYCRLKARSTPKLAAPSATTALGPSSLIRQYSDMLEALCRNDELLPEGLDPHHEIAIAWNDRVELRGHGGSDALRQVAAPALLVGRRGRGQGLDSRAQGCEFVTTSGSAACWRFAWLRSASGPKKR